MEPHEVLISHLCLLKELTAEEKEQLLQYFVLKSFNAGDYLSEYGKVNNCVAFVSTGFCRVYVIDPEGNEVTIHMAGNGNFVGAISSFLSRTPSEEYVQSITNSELMVINHDALQELYSLSATWEHVGRRIMEHLFLMKQKRVISFIKHSAEKRYQYLMETEPEMLLQVPMRYIASYLGITPETLSRIRTKMTL